jgi:DNA-binding NtrC family response regulator
MSRENAAPPMPPAAQAARPPLIRVANTDGAMLDLLREWLGTAGYEVLAGRIDEATGAERALLVIVDVPFSRHGATEILQRVTQAHPGEPILALSATFFSNVHCSGACASRLGVAGVLPKPVAREALLAAVERFAHRNG